MRRLITLMASGLLVLATAAPAVAKPPPNPAWTGSFSCRVADGSTRTYLDSYLGFQAPTVWNIYFGDSTAVAVPITVYTSDADGTRGEWVWSGVGQVGMDIPGLTWCWCRGCLPGATAANDYWAGGDYAFRGASEQP